MRDLFSIPNCPQCHTSNKALSVINKKLPLGERVNFVDIDSGNTKVKFLESFYGTPDKNQWAVPLFVIDKPGIDNSYGLTEVRNNRRTLMTCDYPVDMIIRMLKRLLNIRY